MTTGTSHSSMNSSRFPAEAEAKEPVQHRKNMRITPAKVEIMEKTVERQMVEYSFRALVTTLAKGNRDFR